MKKALIIAIILLTGAYTLYYLDGVMSSRTIIYPDNPPTSEAPVITTTTTSLGEFLVTHYCACDACTGPWSDGITKSGTEATANRTIAADKSIPFGTVLIIEGQEYIVEDRGGSIAGNRVDIFIEDHQEALEKGIYFAEVFIKEE